MRKIILIIALAFICAFVHAQADLAIVGNVSVTAPNPVHVGITVTVTFNVKNLSTTTAAGNTETAILISSPNSSIPTTILTKISLESLAPQAESDNIQVSFPVPYLIKADGDYNIIVNLNYDETISETDHLNNIAGTIIHVASAPWAAQNIPYPIIFVHGYMSDNTTWSTMISSLQTTYGWSYGGNMNFCLNQDGNFQSSFLSDDYKSYSSDADLQKDDFFTINFDVDNTGDWKDYQDNPNDLLPTVDPQESNQAAIAKQGTAIQDAIKYVLKVTGKDKVILVCHSMGGLAAREYLQNSNLFQASDGKKHVAKLVTIGTPHGGTDITASAFEAIFGQYWDGRSEAIRDLRTGYYYSYNYPFHDPDFDKDAPGTYLFGGLEDLNYMRDQDEYFYNADVNCDGNVTGQPLAGLNYKAIPTDLTYSCIVGTGDVLSSGGDGDGVVNTFSANINNFLSVNAPVFTLPKIGTVNIWHLEETKQFSGIMQGMDEPSNDFITGHAYSISSGQLYYGNITYQSTTSPPKDNDGYIINVSSTGSLNIQVYNIPTPVFSIEVFNSAKTSIYSIASNGKSYLNVDVPVTSGNYYIALSGVPTTDSYKYPYAFKCSFTTTTSYCTGTKDLTANSATFSDGSGDNNYSNNSDCRWKIEPSGATSITLKFSEFTVSNPGDTIYAYDGGTTTSKLLGKWTGNTLPTKVTSTGGTMLVRFSTDASTTAAGWKATYTSVRVPVYCSGTTTYTTASGVVSDGSGTNDYGSNSHCSWLITPEGAYTVTLNFTAFNTEATNDVVNVYDGNSEDAPLLGSFSGNTIPSSITSSGGAMFIQFVTNNNTTAAGWSAYYTSYAPYSTTGITKYETWFDNNYKNKTSVSVSQQDTFTLNTAITTTGLSAGLHSFHVHFKDAKYKWSSVVSQFFIKIPPTSGSNTITGYEYWFDDNYANKVTQTISRQENYQLLANINANGLMKGLHSFHIRFSDAGNVWSSVISQFIIYVPSATASKINAYEYWFDSSYANKVFVNTDPTDIFNLNTKLAMGTLSQGLHIFNIRFRDNNNKWSEVTSKFINKSPDDGTTNKIVAYEYWFDNNYAGKKNLTITAQQNYQLVKTLAAKGLSKGLHIFHIRFKDEGGKWSSPISQFIVYTPVSGINQIDLYQYWFDKASAHKTAVTISDSSENYNLNVNISAASLKNGNHILYMRFRQTNKLWSSIIKQSFKKTNTSNIASINLNTTKIMFTDNSPLLVYPNPNNGKFTVKIDDDANIKAINITDANGKVVYRNSSLVKTITLEIDLSKYASGVYYIKATDGKKKYDKKVVIEK